MKAIGDLFKFLGRTEILLGILIGAVIVLASASHAATTGQTANGCSYKIINGKYHYNCDAKTPAVQTSVPRQYQERPAEVVSPSLQRRPAVPARSAGSFSTVSDAGAYNKSRGGSFSNDLFFVDKIYLGAQVGGLGLTTDVGDANTATAFGVSAGADIDRNLGFEISYNYSNHELLMGLLSRNPAITVAPLPGQTLIIEKDAEMVSHHIAAEVQYYLTSPNNRFRPFAGAGVFWRRSNIEEALPANVSGTTNSEFTQSTFGVPLSAGAQFYFTRKLRLIGQFRYLQPVLKSDPDVELNPRATGAATVGGAAAMGGPVVTSLFNEADEDITGSASYSVSAALQFSF